MSQDPVPYGDHPVVLLGGAANSLSAARSLGRAGCDVHVALEATGGEYVLASRHVTSWMRAEPGEPAQASWLDWLLTSAPAGSVVLPASDPALELVARHRSELVAAGLLPVEARDDLVLSLLDKELGYELARAAGVRAPRTCVVSSVEQGVAAAEDLPLPFAVKPRLSHRFLRTGGRTPKAVVIRDRRDLPATLRTIVDLGLPVILTEIVPGVDDEYRSYYGYVTGDGEELLHVTKRKLRQHPVGFGSGTYHLMDDDPEVAELGRRLFDALGLRGLGNVEFKRDARDGGLTLIECNLRLTAATELLRRAGVDLADVVYRRALGLSVEPVDGYRTGLRQWLPGHDLLALRDHRRAGTLTTGAWLTSVAHRQSFPLLDARDLGPSLNGVTTAAATVAARARLRQPRVTPRLLRAGLPSLGRRGKLARVVAAEAGFVAGAGFGGYRRRWRDGSALLAGAPGRSALYRAYWTQAADLLGAHLDDLGGGLLRVRRNGVSTLVWDSLMPVDNPLVLRLAGDKPTTRRLLQQAGVAVSEQVVCTSDELDVAQAFLAQHGTVVVKPAQSGGGIGVTCGVRRSDELLAAFAFALRAGERVVLERLVLGHEFRVLVLDGEVVSTVRRRPPCVVGDGRSSVAELISIENGHRRKDPARRGLYALGVDLDLVMTLRRAGLTLDSVPGRGVRVQVKTAVNENGPSDNDLVTPTPVLAEAARKAVQVLGVQLGAVEIITPDPEAELADVGGRVVEVNTTPGLHYHYQVTNPDGAEPVAVQLLSHLLSLAGQGGAPIWPQRALADTVALVH